MKVSGPPAREYRFRVRCPGFPDSSIHESALSVAIEDAGKCADATGENAWVEDMHKPNPHKPMGTIVFTTAGGWTPHGSEVAKDLGVES